MPRDLAVLENTLYIDPMIVFNAPKAIGCAPEGESVVHLMRVEFV